MTRSILRTRLSAAAAVAVIGLGVAACGSTAATSTPAATSAPAATSGGGGGGGNTSGAAATTAAVTIKNFAFNPSTITVKVGGTVTWTNQDSIGHSVLSTTSAWTTSKVLNQGQTFSHTFTKAGTYPYICGVHNYMTGTVKVVG